jgi:hypothetical protein
MQSGAPWARLRPRRDSYYSYSYYGFFYHGCTYSGYFYHGCTYYGYFYYSYSYYGYFYHGCTYYGYSYHGCTYYGDSYYGCAYYICIDSSRGRHRESSHSRSRCAREPLLGSRGSRAVTRQ